MRTYSGARSIRDYARSLGADPTSVKQLSLATLVSADILHRGWKSRGADVKVGPPVADVVRSNGRFFRQYSGARLSVAALTEQVKADEAYEAIVYIAGIECIRRGKDQVGGPNNEIYLVVTPIDGSNIVVDNDGDGDDKSTVNSIETRTFGGGNGGDFIGLGLPVWKGRNPASLTLSLALWEEDEGDKKEAKAQVQKPVRNVAATVALIAGAATGSPSFASQLPMVDKPAGALAAPIRDLLGLADNHIGSAVKHLSYDDLRGNPPPVRQPDSRIPARTRGEPIAIGNGPDTGEFRIHFFWETRPPTNFSSRFGHRAMHTGVAADGQPVRPSRDNRCASAPGLDPSAPAAVGPHFDRRSATRAPTEAGTSVRDDRYAAPCFGGAAGGTLGSVLQGRSRQGATRMDATTTTTTTTASVRSIIEAPSYDEPYRFGRRPSVRAPFPFTAREFARLLILRSRVQAAMAATEEA